MFAWVVPTIAAQPDATRTDIPGGEFCATAKEALLMIPVVAQSACVVKRSFSAGWEPFCNQLGGVLTAI
jgi:hypothetical protein